MSCNSIAIPVATVAIFVAINCNPVATPKIFTLEIRIRVAINCNFLLLVCSIFYNKYC